MTHGLCGGTQVSPQPHGVVIAGAGKPLAIGTKHHVINGVGMALQGVQRLAALRVPQPHGVVIAGTGKPLAV
ncbi:MAG TPA: hypothetical protein VGD98_17670, partial [Ktedonobacteraceae bacterium]